MDSDVRRYVIVGNGFAGTTAAERLRKHDPACEITLFGDEPDTLYNRISASADAAQTDSRSESDDP